MARRSKGRSRFRDKVASDAHRQKTRASQYGHLSLPKGVAVFKEEPGSRVRLDILPYTVTEENHPDRDDERDIATPGTLWYKRPYKIHNNVGMNNTRVVCPTSVSRKCPICEYRAKLLRDGANWQDDTVKALKPSDRNLYVVVPKRHPKYDEKPHIWDISQFLFQDKLNDELEEDEDYGIFPDLEEGLTLKIRFSEESFGKNTFASTSRIDFEEREEQYDESILDEVPALDDVLSIPTYEQIEKMFFEMDDEGEGNDEDEETPPWSGKSGRRGRDSEEDDEDDADRVPRSRGRLSASEQDDENDDEPEKPRKRKFAKTRREEEDDENDDEPEKPRKPIRRNKPKDDEDERSFKCPYGHKFGHDCDEYDDCEECELWNECMDKREQLAAG